MKKYLAEKVCYRSGKVEFNGFWEIKGNKLVNRVGGFHEYIPSADDEIYEVEHYEDLPFAKYLIDDKFLTGWLSRTGKWYGCDYRNHSDVAYYKFGKEEFEMEEEGFIKITFDPFDRKFLVLNTLRVTKKQRDYILGREDLKDQHYKVMEY